MKNLKQEISYFDILGINENSTKDEIKKAYKELAKQYHPDKFKDANEKRIAEKHFNIIKKAYDEIIKNFDEQNNPEYEKIYENIDFIKFFSQEKEKLDIKSNKKVNSKFEQEAINFMRKNINDFNVDWVFVYECIRKEKMFILWDTDSKELNNIMKKEVIFRQSIIESDLYKCFTKNKSLFFNPNINLKIYIKPDIASKKFEHKITYNQYIVCDNCKGLGCEKCNNGIQKISVEKILKFSSIQDGEIYEIENGGFKSEIVNGKLIINFIYDEKIESDFKIKQIEKTKINIAPVEKSYETIYLLSKRLVNNIIYHKTHSIYISIIITLILIIVILLAVLL